MHHIEPFYKWRDYYVASEDEQSPFYGREYNEFEFSNKIYNYFIHPQWDEIGSETLYIKIIYVNYTKKFAVIEMIGEWNDCIDNDIMLLKRNIIDFLLEKGICKFALICENILNFHFSDDCYYQEWQEEVDNLGGWIVLVNLLNHVAEEMNIGQLYQYMHYDSRYNSMQWRQFRPSHFYQAIEQLIHQRLLR